MYRRFFVNRNSKTGQSGIFLAVSRSAVNRTINDANFLVETELTPKKTEHLGTLFLLIFYMKNLIRLVRTFWFNDEVTAFCFTHGVVISHVYKLKPLSRLAE